jgi:hypothetical protein
MSKKVNWDSLPVMTWKLTLYKEDDEGNQKFYEPHQDFDYSNLSEGFSNDEFSRNKRGGSIMSKQKAINFLYKDWLEYKKYYKNKMGFDMQETFIEYLSREINEYIEVA